jgi:PDZ domain-containing protein
MGSALNSLQAWGISLAILVFMFLSLFLHSFVHIAVARTGGCNLPDRISSTPLGDPAQCWPAAPNAGKEALVALAGPIVNCLFAVLFYVLWNQQINVFINVIASFLIFFNLGLMVFNFIPAFPFDGGRLMRAIVWWILGRPRLATRLAFGLGWGISAGFIVWGIVLIFQKSRFSLETAAATFILSALIIISFILQRGWKGDQPESTVRKNFFATAIRSFLVVLLLLSQVVITVSLIPLNSGIEAPGFTASVEPMVQLPSEYRHSSTGKLILTSVISQTPILSGEWIYAHLDNSIKLKPPEQIIPKDQTVQSVSQKDYQQLQDSEEIAVIVGLRLAGYAIDIVNDGITIVSVLPSSLAIAILQADDVITAVNGNPVSIPLDLTEQLDLLTPGSIISLTIERNGQIMDVSVPIMASEQAEGHARIGISIVQHNSGYTLPFPIEIISQKVLGGPSAGLMFTLGVYDILTDQDLTGGRTIAGTGTVDLDGNVGAIGGVQQKVVAAERAGAEYFFSPAENFTDALSMATRITVVKVETVQDAINFLQSLAPLKTG